MPDSSGLNAPSLRTETYSRFVAHMRNTLWRNRFFSITDQIAVFPKVPFLVVLNIGYCFPNCEYIDRHILWSDVTKIPWSLIFSISSSASLDVTESIPLNMESLLMATIRGRDVTWSRSSTPLTNLFLKSFSSMTQWGGFCACRNCNDNQRCTVIKPSSTVSVLRYCLTLSRVSRNCWSGRSASESWILNTSTLSHPMSANPIWMPCVPLWVPTRNIRSVIRMVVPALKSPANMSWSRGPFGASMILQASGLVIIFLMRPKSDWLATFTSWCPSIMSIPAVDK